MALTGRGLEWSQIDFELFLKDIVIYGRGPARLELNNRVTDDSRYWWSLSWQSVDGEQHQTDAGTLQLCLWRAAIREKQIREKIERQSQKEREGI